MTTTTTHTNVSEMVVIQSCLDIQHISRCDNRLTEGAGRIIMRKIDCMLSADPRFAENLDGLVLIDQPVDAESVQAFRQLIPNVMVAFRHHEEDMNSV
jgi:hypothetical protein